MNKTETSKTARQILFEHGIDIMYLEDDFNCQLFHAMERYKETAVPPPVSEGEMADAETVIFFELKNKKYVTKSGFEITTDMLMKAEHFISDDVRYIKVPLATLPTREQGAKGCQCKQDYKSVMIAGYTYCQNCGERK